ncbi:putative DUF3558 family protein [Actinoalloteichus sp. GBA129-24]|uniref:DUF3558 family protein n=1 Tax=Actinoalloteichus fjordicus TaxID=1612552 RepID=A0AAC9L8K3_9PSEU|nr:putative DUF3558 family protein [Actinoalloteichus fjordicus]APU18312.1 putative DUF3558 family protein [Actinoalloteichus sp. GBA129-24]
METTEQSPAPPAESGDSTGLAPSVSEPKDLAGLDVCTLLTPESAEGLGFGPDGEPRTTGGGSASCSWDSAEGARVTLVADVDRQGLDEVYSRQSLYSDWEELEIAGHPAVRANEGEPTSMCGYIVGIADTQYLDINYFSSGSDGDACAGALAVAESIVPTLPDAN